VRLISRGLLLFAFIRVDTGEQLHYARTTPALVSAPADSIRGRISIGGAGTCVTAQIYLKTTEDSLFTVDGSRDVFVQLIGLEVVVFGKRSSPPPKHPLLQHPIIAVDSFFVREDEGTPARDGVLRRRVFDDVLELGNGRELPVANLPTALDKADRMHVWIAGPPGAPTSAGFIDASRRYWCPE
jgi:hypothetical protein